MRRASDAIVIGAGPYGLSVAAHLREHGVETRVFGKPMAFWQENMPTGMLLRSSWRASYIADPRHEFTLDSFCTATGRTEMSPVPLDYFVEYGHWYRRNLVPEVDERRIVELDLDSDRFVARSEDGEAHSARRVILAIGNFPFSWIPPRLRALPASLAFHSCALRDVAAFRGRSVVVVGGGQSALESAVLLAEAGATVEVLVRSSHVNFTEGRVRPSSNRRRVVQRIKYAPTDVGPPLVSWIAAVPDVLRRLPRGIQDDIEARCLIPLGAHWLKRRLSGVAISKGRTIVSVRQEGDGLSVLLDDGTSRAADHVVAATGYRADLDRIGFLSAPLRSSIRTSSGYPVLGPGLESSVPGLHFAGFAARHSFGPVMCFVVGSGYAAPAITRQVTGRSPSVVSFAF
jgi:FAD-dependent urate hydroxylase